MALDRQVWAMTEWEARMVEKVREDKDLGRGSCSTVDECSTDTELAQQLAEYPGRGASWKEVKTQLKSLESAFWELANEARW